MESAPTYLLRQPTKRYPPTSGELANKDAVARRLRIAKELADEEGVSVADALLGMLLHEVWKST